MSNNGARPPKARCQGCHMDTAGLQLYPDYLCEGYCYSCYLVYVINPLDAKREALIQQLSDVENQLRSKKAAFKPVGKIEKWPCDDCKQTFVSWFAFHDHFEVCTGRSAATRHKLAPSKTPTLRKVKDVFAEGVEI